MSKKSLILVAISLGIVFVLIGVWVFSQSKSITKQLPDDKIQVVVSIMPQKLFVEAIGGEEVEVALLVPPGVNPENYQLKDTQKLELAKADVYFTVGLLPFEKTVVTQVEENPNLKIVDTSRGLPLLRLTDNLSETTSRRIKLDEYGRLCVAAGGSWDAEHAECNGVNRKACQQIGGRFDECASPCRHQSQVEACITLCVEVCAFASQLNMPVYDVHIWLDPLLVKQQGQIILDTLSQSRPEKTQYFTDRYAQFKQKLDDLDQQLTQVFANFAGQTIFAYPPAYGYLASRYGFTQKVLEIPSTEPSTAEWQTTLEELQRQQAKNLVVEAQGNWPNAELMATKLGGRVIQLDPYFHYSANYFENLLTMARLISQP